MPFLPEHEEPSKSIAVTSSTMNLTCNQRAAKLIPCGTIAFTVQERKKLGSFYQSVKESNGNAREGGVPHDSQNTDPISDQNYFRPDPENLK